MADEKDGKVDVHFESLGARPKLTRTPVYTEKGLEYNTNIKIKERQTKLKKLLKEGENLEHLLRLTSDPVVIQPTHAKWLQFYEDFMKANDTYRALLSAEEKKDDDELMNESFELLFDLKKRVEHWFLDKAPGMPITRNASRRGSGSVTSVSVKSRNSSVLSQISVEKMKESQRKAELQARAAALKEKQKLEEDKLKLKMREEELALNTELNVSEAKSKVIEELEKSMINDEFHVQDTARPLNPNAEEYKPVKFENENVVSPPSKVSNQTDINLLKILNKPKAEVHKFRGEALDFQRFKRQFRTRVIENTDSFDERINFLLQYTDGEANKIVKGYSHLDSETGYNAAMKEFESRYGDPDVVANAYVKRALEWPIIKQDDPKALDHFSIFLKESLYAVENIEAARVLEYSENIRLIMKKLPYYLHDKFRNIVYDLKQKGRVVRFSNLVAFVEKESKKANDPLYGRTQIDTGVKFKGSRPPMKDKKPSSRSFATSASNEANQSSQPKFSQPENVVRCVFCNAGHSLDTCKAITEQSLKESERTIDDVPEHSQEDRRFLQTVSESAKLGNGHYVMNLPLKPKDIQMPNNRQVAEHRLSLLVKRFKGDVNFQGQYCDFMNKVLENGYARKVPENELTQTDGHVWYLPHHGVLHPKKNKLRVLFDCAARFQGRSLNDELLQGPNLTNTLVGTLLRFREEQVAIMGDIDSMFYQVRVPERDASLLRFLWWEDGDMNKRVMEYQMMVHLFGARSSPSCANYALKRTAQNCSGRINEEIVNTVMKNFYVDDCLKSVDTVDHAKSVVKDLQAVLSQGGFHIAKWLSNSREVMQSVPAVDRAKEIQDLDLDQDVLPIDRALGVQWNVEFDTFCFKVDLKERPLTRRGMLSMVSSVYDPLGFLAPFMLQAKNLLKDLCRLGLGWDDPIPEKVVDRWFLWLKDVEKLSDFNVTRCLKPLQFGEIQSATLHHFSDASEAGYGIVTYLRLVDSEERTHCSFVIGKSRVAPLKQVTIPRLELTAATVAVRTDKMLKSEIDFQLNDSVFWTDSMSVIRYIKNTSSGFHTFVANRLSVIHEGSNPDQWRYVSTRLNPADVASRGIQATDLLEHLIEAPSFLWQSELLESPTRISESKPDDDPEVKKINFQKSVTDTVDRELVDDPIHKLISHYSSWLKLKRAVSWILKVRARLLQRAQYRKNDLVDLSRPIDNNSLTVQDLNKAEFAVISYIQRNTFPEEMATLLSENSKLKRDSSIRNLDPVFGGGLLRVGGRLNESSMPIEMKNPIILPKNCHVSTLILRQIHQNLNHVGRNQMLSKLREKFWLINAPSAIRKLISSCVICRKQRGKVGEQKMSSLPKDRVTPNDPPFTCVGVDYFGPFEVKQGRSYVKRYGVIFTCLASRAVHLEIAASLDTDSYINALRRFVARRGQVTKIRSDNGSNFIGANKDLKKAIADWNKHQIQNAMLQRNVDWQFNPPAGSHHGGVWERMIRTVRQTLHSVMKEQTLSDEALYTLFCEVESIINDRPITMNPDSHDDLEALTPNHLLLMKRKPNLPPGIFVKTDSYTRRRWRQVQYMADLFWHRWTREYLPLLQERQKWCEKKRNLCVGDVVLVVDSNAPRNSWLLGKVTETIPDKLGHVRQVRLRTAFNTNLVRPVDKLCLLLESETVN